MRILHLVDRLSQRGGAYRHLLGVFDSLVEAGHELRVAVGSVDTPTPAGVALEHVIGLDARERRRLGTPDARGADILDRMAGEFRPDVLHVHTVLNPTALEWAAERGAVMTVQDHRWFCPTRGKWTLEGQVCRSRMQRDTCRGCFDDASYFEAVFALTQERLAAVRKMRLTVLSHYMKSELEAAGVAAERIAVIPPFAHGLDPEAVPDGPPCVLFVGRLAETKGVRDAIAAWRTAALDLPLVFAGSGPLRAELEREGFDVLGWQPPEALSRTYRRAAAVLFPPRWQEPFGLVGLEALTLGVPVAAWRSGGVIDWHGEAGLVGWGDVTALAARLREIAGGRALASVGFERRALVNRLVSVYEGSAPPASS